jgi:hypothetical protein
VAQAAAAEQALQHATAYEQALAARAAAAQQPRVEPWPPDARLAPPGYAPPNPKELQQQPPRSQASHFFPWHAD